MHPREDDCTYHEERARIELSRSYEDKREFEGFMERQLREIGAKIDDLIFSAKGTQAEAINALREKQFWAQLKLEELKESSDEARIELQARLTRAWIELKNAVEAL